MDQVSLALSFSSVPDPADIIIMGGNKSAKYLLVLYVFYSYSRNWFSLSGVCEGPGLAG